MPSQLSWYLENRVMQIVNHGDVADQDLFDIDESVIQYIDQSSAPLVHLIVDHRNGNNAPSAKGLTQLNWPKNPRLGWTILIGLKNPFQRFVTVVAANFFKIRLRLVNTMDEALDFLNEVDSTLPALRDKNLDKAS
jgi:hypothetical protein